MKTKFVLVACLATLACACQQKSADMKKDNNQMMDDQNSQERRKQEQPQKSTGGCCEAEKPEAKIEAPKQSTTAATPEVKVDKAQ